MSLLTLAIDVGGSSIKAILLHQNGTLASHRSQIAAPHPAIPDVMITSLIDLILSMGECDRISIGFPSVVEQGVTRGAINLHPDWDGFPLGQILQAKLDKPIRIANDADVQGYGAISGQGVELVITLGTGFGSALFFNGALLPNLELGQHIWRDRDTYEDCLGQLALEQIGLGAWIDRLSQAIASLYKLFNFEKLYIGGGNARLLSISSLDLSPNLLPKVAIISNDLGLMGGLALWA